MPTYTDRTGVSTTHTVRSTGSVLELLLQEDGDHLLQEDGEPIGLEFPSGYGNRTGVSTTYTTR